MTEAVVVFLICSVLVEAITNIVKSIYKSGEGVQIPVILSILIAVAVTIPAGIDLFALLGIVFPVPYLGAMFTGIIMSRGSNFFSDLLYKVQNPSQPK